MLSPCAVYRYALTRDWFPKDKGHVLFVMLNPSTADADVDDPTIRRCQSFAQRWSYDGITVVNLFALRSTHPEALLTVSDPVGEMNDDVIESYATAAGIGMVVAAWGTHPATKRRLRASHVTQRITKTGRDVHCLGTTATGAPKHPLYIKADQPPVVWRKGES